MTPDPVADDRAPEAAEDPAWAKSCARCGHSWTSHAVPGCVECDCTVTTAPAEPVAAQRTAADPRIEAIRALAAKWEALADANERARGRPTAVAGYYRRLAAQLRAALGDQP